MYKTAEKQKLQIGTKAAPAQRATSVPTTAIPNFALASMGGSDGNGYANPNLDQMMQARLLRVGERPQAQIPQAENEADRLSASVHGGSPEGVKSMMGRRMGADFSGVRFHTGAAAAARADAMGARAYTSGADVYFGAGGFDPTVAAHELVHTVQQGVVDSGVSTMTTPTGGVQMWKSAVPTKKKKDESTPAQTSAPEGTGAAAAASETKKRSLPRRMWDSTVGKAIRSHHDAMDKLYDAKHGAHSDWEDLSVGDRAIWNLKNPLVAMEYMLSSKDTLESKVNTRKDKRQRERLAAREVLKSWTGENGRAGTSMLTRDASGEFSIGFHQPANQQQASQPANQQQTGQQASQQQANQPANQTNPTGVGAAIGEVVEKAGGIAELADNASTPVGLVSNVLDSGLGKGLNTGLGVLGVGTGAVGLAQDVKELVENRKDSTTMEKIDTVVNMISNGAKIGGGVTAILEAPGVPGAGAAGGVMSLMSAGADIYQGGRDVYQGQKKRSAMQEIKKEFGDQTRTEMTPDKLLTKDSASIGEMEGSRQLIGGIGKVTTGAIDAVSGVAQVAGAGGAATAALGGASALTKGGFAIADHHQRSRMKKKMMEQTTGLTDNDILQAQQDKHIQNFSRMKQAILKEAGYASGKRAELFSEQTALRGEYMAGKANAAGTANATEDDAQAERLVTGLNVQKRGGSYRGEEVAKQMGLDKTQEEILSGVNEIQELAAKRRVERVQKEQQRQLKEHRKQQKEQQKQQQRQQKEQQKQQQRQQKEQQRQQKELAKRQQAAASGH